MRSHWKRWIAGLLTAVMLVTMLPATAYAAVSDLLGNSAVENAALLAALKEVYGDDAEAYLAVLEQYGLLDEDGNFVTDEKIVMNGVEYTLDEIEMILNDPDTDLSTVVEVDGTFLTLEELKTIVEIERYLAYLKATYFTEQDLTDEQIDSFYDLADAWANGNVQLMAADGFDGVGPAGLDHDVRLKVTGSGDASEDSTYTVTVTPNKAQTVDVTFSWRAVSANAEVEGSGDVTIQAGSTAPVTLTINVGEVDARTQGDATFLVQFYDVKNALFDNDQTRRDLTVSVAVEDTFKYYEKIEERIFDRGIYDYSDDSIYNDANIPNYNKALIRKILQEGNPMEERAAETYAMNLSDGTYYASLATENTGVYRIEYGRPGTGGNGFWGHFGKNTPEKEVPLKVSLEVGLDGEKKVVATRENLGFSWDESYTLSDTKTTWGQGEIDPDSVFTVAINTTGYYAHIIAYWSQADIAMIPSVGTSVTLIVQETNRNADVSFSVTPGTYYAGQNVPIIATFSYPMKIDKGMTITVNGDTTLTPVEVGTTAESCTFLYPVDETSGGSITITDTSFVGDGKADTATGANELGMNIALAADSPVTIGSQVSTDLVALVSLDKEDAFGQPQLAVSREPNQLPVLTITLPLTNYRDWLMQEGVLQEDGTLPNLKVLTGQTGTEQYSFRVDNLQTPTALTVQITLPNNQSTRDLTGQVDFLLDDYVLIAQGLEYTLAGSVPLTSSDWHDFSVSTFIKYKDDTPTYYPVGTPQVYTNEMNNIDGVYFTFSMKEGADSTYTWSDTDKVVVYESIEDKPDNIAGEDIHFAFVGRNSLFKDVVKSTDGSGSYRIEFEPTNGVASVDIYACNGDMADEKLTTVNIQCYDFGGMEPFIDIPASGSSLTVREGEDVRVNWSSNVCTMNKTAGENGEFVPTTFTVQLCETVYDYEALMSRMDDCFTPVEGAEWTVTTTETDDFISSFTIPWEGGLEKLYEKDLRKAAVLVSTEYDGQMMGWHAEEDKQGENRLVVDGILVTDIPNVDDPDYDDYDGPFPENYSFAYITMLSPPASVTLEKPEGGLYQTDNNGQDQNITLSWTAENLDVENGGKFELYIAGGEDPISEASLSEDGVSYDETTKTYSYTLNVPAVEPTAGDPASYRDAYTITVKVKNAADSAWAYDSYVLYVYDQDILNILLDHDEDTGSTHTMSNVEKIKALWGNGGETGSNKIVELQRDIALKNVISINYGEYAWAELADQIRWSSSNSKVATVNYQQGTLYENIENFSYTSYRPSTDFVLSGLKDGSTTITATHGKLNSITDQLEVNVETLRDQLYLFQCYPKVKTTLNYKVYTDAAQTATKEYTLETNDKGEAAIYAEFGIAGDIYCKSEVREDNEDVTYLGIIYNRDLTSSEADSTKLQLYPVNTLRLRRAAQAEIFLKNPDGTPYVGQVTFRGGVYRAGEYCTGTADSEVKFGLQGEKDRTQWQPGDVSQTVMTEKNGRLLVTMDLAQFKTEDLTSEIQAGEKLYYLFQIEYGNGSSADYYPIFLRVDANLNLDDIAATGQNIVAWEKNESGQKQPFIAQQTLKYSPKSSANVADIRKNTGNVGPSETFPTAYVTTSVMWWGDERAADPSRKNTVMLQDATGKTPDCQTSTTVRYPFTDMVFTENLMTMDKAGMDEWGMASGESRGMRAVFSEDGTNASRTVSLPFKMVNMIGVVQASNSDALNDSMDDLKAGMKVDKSDSISEMGNDDAFTGSGLKLLSDDASYDPKEDKFAVRLYATSDPMVFRALFGVNMGDLDPGVYPEYDDPENMTFVHGDASTSDNAELEAVPSVFDIYSMVKGDYLSNAKQEAQMAKAGKGSVGTSMALGGYMEANISYNSSTCKWECKPISGGFNVGAGVDYTWIFNSFVGIVPITASLTLGGALEIRMDMQQGNYYEVSSGMDALKSANDTTAFNNALKTASYAEATGNDYLTNLRIYFYMRAFAGVGFDYSVVAFKIGVFGQLNLDMQFEWLNRSYLKEEGTNISVVGPVDSRQDEVISGSNLTVSGSTGIEFVFKFLFISYEKIFCSIGFESESDDPGWRTIEEIWKANKTINGSVVTRMAMPNGQVMYAVDLGAQMESRDYVDAADQVWVGGRPSIGLFSLDDRDTTLAQALQTGAYPYANPVLTDDGEVMFYLSDRGSEGLYADPTNVTNTRVTVSTKSNGHFQEGTRFDGGKYWNEDQWIGEGYGDSSVKVAGSDGNYAAVWVRQTEDFTDYAEDLNGTLDATQQMLQMNSTEIIAATPYEYEGEMMWNLTQITDNSTPDLAPVVATSEGRIIVAWREVSSSSASDLTSFDQQDAIRFAVCEKKNGKWEWEWETDEILATQYVAAQTLYDGTGSKASVKGLEMAMLSDGTAAVVYTLDTDSTNDSTTDWETVVAIIPAGSDSENGDTRHEDTVHTFRLTTDDNLDENPQITTAKFDDGQERFVVAWHTERAITDAANGETESDIRLAVMDANCALYANMPESLSMATGGTGDTIDANFRFAKNAGSIDDLAILWVDSVSAEASETSYGSLEAAISDNSTNVGHDVLKAVKFVEAGESYSLSGTVVVAEMRSDTLIDHFDAYVSDTDKHEIKSVILGTNYTEVKKRQVTVSDGNPENDKSIDITVANPISGMYTATEHFTNQIQESAVMLAYHELYTNSDIDVQFTIRNTGMDAITKLEIYADGTDDPVYTSNSTQLNLLPNRDITVTAKFPTGEAIENADYTIKATFEGQSNPVTLDGTLYLDIPDVGISRVTTVKQADGERTLRYALHNKMDASLADPKDDWQVKVGFYADQSCTTPLKDEQGSDLVITITNQTDLALIDAGGYSAEVTLPVASYMTGEGGVQEEIPGTGINVYVKAWIEAPEHGTWGAYDTVSEYFTGNNTTTVTLESLAERRGEPVTVDYDMSSDSGNTTVTATAQYNYLGGTESGNLIVTLLDADGQPIAKQQSYTKENGLLTLTKEGTGSQTFVFEGVTNAADVRVEFSDLVLQASSVELDHISVGGHTAVFDPSTNTYTVHAVGLTSGILDIAPKDPQYAMIKLNSQNYSVSAPYAATFVPGETTWSITVSNGGSSANYTLKLINNADIVSVTGVNLNKTNLTLTVDGTEQLTATVEPATATNKSVTWSSSNTSVATVDNSGKVTAVGSGTATITVTTADGGKTATCTVTVEAGSTPTVPVNSVSLNQTSLTLTTGSTDHLTATITPSNATNKGLNWTSSDPSVVSVDGNGNITAHKAGTATITVTTADGGKTATCTVTVTADSGNSGGGSGSGGGSSSYAVNIDAGTDHGTVTVRPTRAESGQTVTITTKPDAGYQVGKVTVTRANGTTVAVTDKGDGVYTFTMPNSRVTVDVTFVPVDTACDGGADCPSRAFTDLSATAWYHEAVDYVLINGIMGGYGGGLFGPNDSLSRAQLCQILYNREGRPTVTGSSPFTDVADTAWYADAVIWANANGIVGGYGNGTFGPNDPITREQLAAILWRYVGSPASSHTLAGYTDADQVSSWAMDAMLWANENSILNGDGSGHLIPKGNATRAQVAQMIKNFIQNLEKNT